MAARLLGGAATGFLATLALYEALDARPSRLELRPDVRQAELERRKAKLAKLRRSATQKSERAAQAVVATLVGVASGVLAAAKRPAARGSESAMETPSAVTLLVDPPKLSPQRKPRASGPPWPSDPGELKRLAATFRAFSRRRLADQEAARADKERHMQEQREADEIEAVRVAEQTASFAARQKANEAAKPIVEHWQKRRLQERLARFDAAIARGSPIDQKAYEKTLSDLASLR